MVVREPFDEGDAFVDLIGAKRGRRRATDRVGDRTCLVTHGCPVFDGGTHVAQHVSDVGRERLQCRTVDRPVHFQMDERFDPTRRRVVGCESGQRAIRGSLDADDRMDDEVQRQAVAIRFHRHRVDEKRHVVVDDLDDRMLRQPPLLLDRRIERAHARLARCTLAGEVPVGERRAIQVGGQSFLQVLGIYLLVVACDKVLQRRAKVRSDAGRDELGDLLLPLSARFLGDIGHGTPSTYFFGDTAMPTASV